MIFASENDRFIVWWFIGGPVAIDSHIRTEGWNIQIIDDGIHFMFGDERTVEKCDSRRGLQEKKTHT